MWTLGVIFVVLALAAQLLLGHEPPLITFVDRGGYALRTVSLPSDERTLRVSASQILHAAAPAPSPCCVYHSAALGCIVLGWSDGRVDAFAMDSAERLYALQSTSVAAVTSLCCFASGAAESTGLVPRRAFASRATDRFIVSGHADGSLSVWSAGAYSFSEAFSLPSHARAIVCTLPSSIEHEVANVQPNAQSRRRAATAVAASRAASAAAAAPCGLIVASADGELKVWGWSAGSPGAAGSVSTSAASSSPSGQFALRGYMNVARAGRQLCCARVLCETQLALGFTGGVLEIWPIPMSPSGPTIATAKAPLQSVQMLTTAVVTSLSVSVPFPNANASLAESLMVIITTSADGLVGRWALDGQAHMRTLRAQKWLMLTVAATAAQLLPSPDTREGGGGDGGGDDNPGSWEVVAAISNYLTVVERCTPQALRAAAAVAPGVPPPLSFTATDGASSRASSNVPDCWFDTFHTRAARAPFMSAVGETGPAELVKIVSGRAPTAPASVDLDQVHQAATAAAAPAASSDASAPGGGIDSEPTAGAPTTRSKRTRGVYKTTNAMLGFGAEEDEATASDSSDDENLPSEPSEPHTQQTTDDFAVTLPGIVTLTRPKGDSVPCPLVESGPSRLQQRVRTAPSLPGGKRVRERTQPSSPMASSPPSAAKVKPNVDSNANTPLTGFDYDDGEHSGQDEGEDGDGDDDDNSARSVVRVVIPNPALSDVRSPAVEGDTHGNQGRPHSPSAMLAHKAMRMDLSDMHWSGSPPPTPLVGAVNAGAQSSAALGDRGDRPSLTAPATMAKPGSGSSTRRGRTEAGLEGVRSSSAPNLQLDVVTDNAWDPEGPGPGYSTESLLGVSAPLAKRAAFNLDRSTQPVSHGLPGVGSSVPVGHSDKRLKQGKQRARQQSRHAKALLLQRKTNSSATDETKAVVGKGSNKPGVRVPPTREALAMGKVGVMAVNLTEQDPSASEPSSIFVLRPAVIRKRRRDPSYFVRPAGDAQQLLSDSEDEDDDLPRGAALSAAAARARDAFAAANAEAARESPDEPATELESEPEPESEEEAAVPLTERELYEQELRAIFNELAAGAEALSYQRLIKWDRLESSMRRGEVAETLIKNLFRQAHRNMNHGRATFSAFLTFVDELDAHLVEVSTVLGW